MTTRFPDPLAERAMPGLSSHFTVAPGADFARLPSPDGSAPFVSSG
jgi:hypothetical protein